MKPYKGIAMEGAIARWYDKTRGRNPDQPLIARRIREILQNGGRILEVAPGPGYLAIELSKLGNYQVVGLDISKSFVEIAKSNAKKEMATVEFCYGNASNMPFESNSFDFVICVAAFKNFREPVQAICEMHRVLKPGSKALIIDLLRDSSSEDIRAHIKRDLKLRGASALLTKLIFKYFLLKNAYTKREIENFVSQSKFTGCDIGQNTVCLDVLLKK